MLEKDDISSKEDATVPPSGKDAADTTPDEQVSDISNMLDFLEGKPVAAPTTVGAAPVATPEPAAAPEPTPVAAAPGPVAPAPVPTEAPKPAPAAPAEDPLELMRAEVVRMAGLLQRRNVQPAPAPDAAPATVAAPTAVLAPVEKPPDFGTPMKFVDAESWEEIKDDSDKVNALLSGVARNTREWVLQGLPSMMKEYVDRQVYLQTVIADFYDKHADLRPYRDYVAARAEVLETVPENAGKPAEEILALVAEDVRRTLHLVPPMQSAPIAAAGPAVRPALPTRGKPAPRRQPPAAKEPGQEDMMADMLEFAEKEGFMGR